MAKFRGQKNLHIGEDIHAERDGEGSGYVIELDGKRAKDLSDYLASEGFTLDASPDAE
jgi:hypothetical protein